MVADLSVVNKSAATEGENLTKFVPFTHLPPLITPISINGLCLIRRTEALSAVDSFVAIGPSDVPLDLRQSFYCSNWVRRRRLWTRDVHGTPTGTPLCSLSQISFIWHLLAILTCSTVAMWTASFETQNGDVVTISVQDHDDSKFEIQINYKKPNGVLVSEASA